MAREGELNGDVDLEGCVAAFEAAWRTDPRPDLPQFLPAVDHPAYRVILRELVRVDLEHGWAHQQPAPLHDYLQRFPQLLNYADTLQAIAFEEYRLRRQAGQATTPEEYAKEFGIDTASWPILPRAAPVEEPASPADSWGDSAGESPVLGSLRASDPESARLLAQALSALPEVESTFLGFRLIAELGRGGFGRVYLAKQGDLANRLVALKISIDVFGESQALARLQHTNIVPVYSVHRAGLFQAVCMPYFGPTTLADVVRRLTQRGTLPTSAGELINVIQDRNLRSRQNAPQVAGSDQNVAAQMLDGKSYIDAILTLALGLADGLGHAHQRGILHRDLKPANILLTDEGQPMLVDFNLSSDTGRNTNTGVARIGGTLPYMSPEHLAALQYLPPAGVVVDTRSDLYSVGVILFELLTGKLPFPPEYGPPGETVPRLRAARLNPPPRLRPLNPAVSPAVEAIVRHLLEPEPARRYQTAQALQADLQAQLTSRPLRHISEPSLRERGAKWLRRHPRLMSPAGLGMLTVFLLAWVAVLFFWSNLQREREISAQAEHEKAKLAVLKQQAEESFADFQSALTLFWKHEDEVVDVRTRLDEELWSVRSQTGARADGTRLLLERYHVLDNPDWQKAGAVEHLPPEQREELQRDIGELLYLLAGVQLLDVGQMQDGLRHNAPLWILGQSWLRPDPFGIVRGMTVLQLDSIRHLNELAWACYSENQLPRSVVLQRAVIAHLSGQRKLAEELELQSEKIKPRSARDSYLTACEYVALRRYQTALAFAKRACEQEPRKYNTWFVMAICYRETKDKARWIMCKAIGTTLKLGPLGMEQQMRIVPDLLIP